ncbi:Dynamin superfamily [Candidatus Nanopelagicaceae bacterium]
MFDPKLTLSSLADKALSIVQESDEFLYAIKADTVSIKTEIESIVQEINEPQIVTIAILGEAGAGKSTLINTLLGRQFLPWSNSNVCTAAVTRVKYNANSEYKISITFESAATWQEELQGIKKELEAANSSREDDGLNHSRKTLEPDSKDQRAKLKALYGPDSYKEFLETLDIDVLKAGPNLQKILDNGYAEHVIQSADEVMPLLQKYLIKNGEIDENWPLVVDVLVEGPFDALKNGCELVDLPGVADSNQARAQKTIKYIDSAKFIFIAYEAKRPPSDVIQEIFRSSRLLKDRLLLDAKESALTFIATKSDDFGVDDPKFNSLGTDPTLQQKSQYVMEQRKKALVEELESFAESVVENVTDERKAREIADAINASACFFVSSSEYTRMKSENYVSSQSDKYKTLGDTGIPYVASHIDSLTLEEGPKAHYRHLWNKLLGVDDNFRLIYNGEFVKYIGRELLNDERIEKLKTQIAQFTVDLNSATSEVIYDSKNRLESGVKDFFLSTNVDQRAIARVLGNYSNYLEDLNWATLRATAVRGGWFLNSRGKEVDLIQGAAEPIIKKFLGPWVELFSTNLIDILQFLELRLDGLGDKYVSLIRVAQEDVSDELLFVSGLDNLLDAVENLLDRDISELKKAIKHEIESRRQTLIDLIVASVGKVLSPAIQRAAEERGPGMKGRMINLLVDGAGNFAPETYERVTKEITEAVNVTSDRINKLFNMVPEVTEQRSAAISGYFDNLTKKPTVVKEGDFEIFGAKVTEYTRFIIENGSEFAKSVSAREPEAFSLARKGDLVAKGFMNPNAPYIAVDGSNVATLNLGGTNKATNLEILLSCVQSLKKKYVGANIEIFVDANFRHHLRTEHEKKMYSDLAIAREITEGPGGVRADDIFLQSVQSHSGRVVSNDKFKEERAKYPFVDEGGRIITHTRTADGSWVFEERKPKNKEFPKALRTVSKESGSDQVASWLGEMYCVKCRDDRQVEGRIKLNDAGRRMAFGVCPFCGTRTVKSLD